MHLNHGQAALPWGGENKGPSSPILRTVCARTPPGYTVRVWERVAAHGSVSCRVVFHVFVLPAGGDPA